MGACTNIPQQNKSKTGSKLKKQQAEHLTINYADVGVGSRKTGSGVHDNKENIADQNKEIKRTKFQSKIEIMEGSTHSISNKDQGESSNLISNVLILLRRKTGIFQYTDCPIDNEEIEDIDKQLGPFEVPFFGIKGQLQPSWKKVSMGDDSEVWWYVGEWKNGLMHGQGTAYNESEGYLLSGLFIHGKISGNNCRKIMKNGSYYIGSLNEYFEAEGKGEIHYKEGGKYKGGFIGGLPNGTGKLVTLDHQFEGNFENGIKKYGTLNEAEGTYKGQFQNNLKHGEGVYMPKNGLQVSGLFHNNKLKVKKAVTQNVELPQGL